MPETSRTAKEKARMRKGKLIIDSVAYGFFNIQPDSDSDDEDTPRRSTANSKAERQYEQPEDMPMEDEV